MAKRKKKNRRVLRKLAVLVLAVVAAGVNPLVSAANRHFFG